MSKIELIEHTIESIKKMNVYEKLQEMRVALQRKEIKKTGKNSYSNFMYYELPDFLPHLTVLMLEYRVMSKFDCESAPILELINIDKPDEKVVFKMESAEAIIKGAQPIQNYGSKITYFRRYLYQVAFEIVESDAVDAQDNSKKDNEKHSNVSNNVTLATNEQVKKISELVTKLNAQEWLTKILENRKVKYIRELSFEQADGCLAKLKMRDDETNKDIDM